MSEEKIFLAPRSPSFQACADCVEVLWGFDGIGLMNNNNAVLSFNVGLIGEKYIKMVCNVFISEAGNYSYKTGEFVLYYSMV